MGYPSYKLWNADKNDTKLAWIIAINNQISIFIWFDWLKSHLYNVYNAHILYKSSSWGTHSWVTEQFAIISKSKLNYCIILNFGDDFSMSF